MFAICCFYSLHSFLRLKKEGGREGEEEREREREGRGEMPYTNFEPPPPPLSTHFLYIHNNSLRFPLYTWVVACQSHRHGIVLGHASRVDFLYLCRKKRRKIRRKRGWEKKRESKHNVLPIVQVIPIYICKKRGKMNRHKRSLTLMFPGVIPMALDSSLGGTFLSDPSTMST